MKPLIQSPAPCGRSRYWSIWSSSVPGRCSHGIPGKSWDHFLAGRAALTFTWGDLGLWLSRRAARSRARLALHLPGTSQYYSLAQHQWVKTGQPNRVGNTIGGSWGGVISKFSKAPEATYYFLALMASMEKSQVYAARGWDGPDPGRRYHFLPPHGSGQLEIYPKAGWDEADIRDLSAGLF